MTIHLLPQVPVHSQVTKHFIKSAIDFSLGCFGKGDLIFELCLGHVVEKVGRELIQDHIVHWDPKMVVIARYLANLHGTPRHITALGHHDPAANKRLSDHWRDSLDTITISDGYISGRGINL